MEFIEPKAEMIKQDDHLTWATDATFRMEEAARNCYKSTSRGESRIDFLKKVIKPGKKHGHVSIAEHAGLLLVFERTNLEKMFGMALATPDLARGMQQLKDGHFAVSGNLRMWLEYVATKDFDRSVLHMLNTAYPAFFPYTEDESNWSESMPHIESYPMTYGKLKERSVSNLGLDLERHSLVQFKISGSRVMQQQLTRHRRPVYSIESMRYVDYNKKVGVRFALPHTAGPLFKLMAQALELPYKLMFRKMKAEDRRYLLPLGVVGDIYMTATIRDWRHIMEMRTAKKAQKEIRLLAQSIEKQINELTGANNGEN